MKLSPEAKARADAVMGRENYRQALWGEEEHRRVKALATNENPRFNELVDYHVERTRRSYKMIIDGYMEAYRMDGTLIDDEDRHEIIMEIKALVDRRFHDITTREGNPDFRHPLTHAKIPNMDAYLKSQFDRLVGEALLELDVARTDLIIEKRKQPEASGSSYALHVQGDVIGGAQVGPNNTQNITDIHSINGKPKIRWSQLKPVVGVQRVSGVGDVEVTEQNIKEAGEIGGDPWVDICDATAFGAVVRKYALGLFTPE
jgi:hypothetical protein